MPRNPYPIDEKDLTDCDRRQGFAIQQAFLPKSSFPVTFPSPNMQGLAVTQGLLDGIINMYVVCGSDGILEYMLFRDGGPDAFIQLPVRRGQRVDGQFKRFGPNTTVYPLIAYVNG